MTAPKRPLVLLIVAASLLAAATSFGVSQSRQSAQRQREFESLHRQMRNQDRKLKDLQADLAKCRAEQQSLEWYRESWRKLAREKARRDLTPLWPLIERKLPAWVHMWKGFVPDLGPDSFAGGVLEEGYYLGGTNTVKFRMSDLSVYDRKLLVTSPDGGRLAWPNDSASIESENGKCAWIGAPDSAVSVIDVKKQTSTRLLFTGTPASYDDAVWLDSNRLLVVGWIMPDTEKEHAPTIYVLDLKHKTYSSYQGPSTNDRRFLGHGYYLRQKHPEWPWNDARH